MHLTPYLNQSGECGASTRYFYVICFDVINQAKLHTEMYNVF